jgi:hypothetical protein
MRAVITMVSEQMVTTLLTVPGYVVTHNRGIVTELAAAAGWTATSKGNEALSDAMTALRRTAGALKANAIVGVSASTFGARGGITNALGGDAVGVLLVGTAVSVTPLEDSPQ